MPPIAFSGMLDFPDFPTDSLAVDRLIIRDQALAFQMSARFSEGTLDLEAVAPWSAVRRLWFVRATTRLRGGRPEAADIFFTAVVPSENAQSCQVEGVWVALDREADRWRFAGTLQRFVQGEEA